MGVHPVGVPKLRLHVDRDRAAEVAGSTEGGASNGCGRRGRHLGGAADRRSGGTMQATPCAALRHELALVDVLVVPFEIGAARPIGTIRDEQSGRERVAEVGVDLRIGRSAALEAGRAVDA